MNIHLFTSESTNQAIRLIKSININRCYRDNFVIRTINSTEINTDLNIEPDDLLIILAQDEYELNILADNKEKFSNNRVIIVLSESSEEIINKAYLLNPRFIEFTDNSYAHLVEIINKISKECAKHSYPLRSRHCEYHHQGGSL